MEIDTLMEEARMGVLDWRRITREDLVRMIDAWDGDRLTFTGIVRRALLLPNVTCRTLAPDLPDSRSKNPSRTMAALTVRMSRYAGGQKPTKAPEKVLQLIRQKLAPAAGHDAGEMPYRQPTAA
jgi:hypothetical protein